MARGGVLPPCGYRFESLAANMLQQWVCMKMDGRSGGPTGYNRILTLDPSPLVGGAGSRDQGHNL